MPEPDVPTFSFDAYRGDVIEADITVTKGGLAYDLTSVQQIWFTGKKNVNDSDSSAVFQKTLYPDDTGISVVGDPTTGLLRLKILGEDTDAVTFDNNAKSLALVCDLQILEDDGDTVTCARGTITLWPDVTRTTQPPLSGGVEPPPRA